MCRLQVRSFSEGRRALLPLGLLTWLGLAALQTPLLAAAPPNDNFAAATPITGYWGSITGTNTGATAEPGEPAHAGSAAAHSVWFQFTPIQDGILTVHTAGSAFNTRLAAYSFPGNTNASVAALFPEAANVSLNLGSVYGPSFSGPGTSFIRFPVKLGQTYYIAVDGAGGATGMYTLTWCYNFAGVFYMTKPLREARKDEGQMQFFVSRVFGTAGRVQVTVTNSVYPGPFISATNGYDYQFNSSTMTFNDYETLQSFNVPIFDVPFAGQLDTNCEFVLNPNSYFALAITNVALDPNENTNLIAPPVFLPSSSVNVSVGHLLDPDVFAGDGNVPANASVPRPGCFTNSVINFLVKHQTTTEYIGDGDGYVHIWFTRGGTGGAGQSCSINWGIDSSSKALANLGDLLNNTFGLWPESDYATPQPNSLPLGDSPSDFGPPYSGTVSWGANDAAPKEVLIPIINDQLVEFDEDFIIDLSNDGAQGCEMGEANSEVVTIQFDVDDQPAGGLEPGYNAHNDPPGNPNPGANGPVLALAVQPTDQAVIIGGDFTAYNSHLRNRIARINFDGSLDTTFNPGNGADSFVSSVAIQSDGGILIGGDFYSVGGVDRYKVARLNTDGSVDLTFNPGAGADDTVWSLALGQINNTNNIIIGGQFFNYNDYPCTHVARLDMQGNLDPTFNTSQLQLDGTVWAVAEQADGRVVIGGDFTTVNGVSRSHIARLNTDGSLDTSFDPGLGANDTIYTVQVQPNGLILVGGAFTQFHTAANRGVTRLQANGALDPTFNPGTAANGVVYTVFYSPADQFIYVGGDFTSFNGSRRVGLARLNPDGTVDTGFLDTAYNQFAGFTNPLLNPDLDPPNAVYAVGLENVIANGLTLQDPVIGGSFYRVGGGGGTRRSLDIRQNLTLLRGGSTIGPGNLTLTYPTYSVDENGGHLWVTLTRTNGTLGTVGARFSPDPQPVGEGAAVYGHDYSFNAVQYEHPIWNSTWSTSRMLSDGIWGQTYPNPISVLPNNIFPAAFDNADVTIIDNSIVDGNRSFNLNLTMPWQYDTFFLGGANIPLATALGEESTTSSLIVDNEQRLGGFTFITTNYVFSENVGTANILVLRTNGADVQATLHYQTYDLPPDPTHARSNINYVPVSGTLTFRPGVTNQSFPITIIPDHTVTPDLGLLLVITNFSPAGVQAGITSGYLTIIDQDYPGGHLNFGSASYATNETAGGAVITVTREGSALGSLTVVCSTTNTVASATNSPAAPGTNYVPVSATLVWTNGDSSPKTFVVPVLHDGQVTSNLTVGLVLSSPTLNSLANPGTIGPQGTAVLTIVNVDQVGTLAFSSPSYNQNENGGYAIIPVVRQGGQAGTITAQFATSDFTAYAGKDYVATNGTLIFGPGEVSKVFTVPLIDNSVQDPARAVTLTLANVTPAGALGYPSVALLNIIDDETYNEPPGGDDNAFYASFDGPINSVALQPDGRIVVAGSFTLADSITRHRIARLMPNGSLDYSFASAPGQADNPIRSLALQSDGRMLVGGEFTNYDGVARNYFARANLDGTLDWQFDPGSGLNAIVNAVAETWADTNRTTRRILVGGNFTLANGAPRNYLAQFLDTGDVDPNFNPNLTGNGIDGAVWAIAVQPDLRILIGGDFQTINGVSRKHVARLNQDGSLDLSFDPGSGASDSVRALAVQLDGRIVIGGLFTNFNNTLQNRFARLNADGPLDATFNGGVGADGAVFTIAIQPDERILLGGAFTRCSGVTRNRITRLNPDGSVDPSINFGNGCDNYVASMVVQTNDFIVLGGGFLNYDNISTPYLARIFGRSIAGSGQFEFTTATYGVNETDTNAVLTVRRRGGTAGTSNSPNISVTVAVTDGTATNGINYIGGLYTNTFPPGETYESFQVPVLHDFQVTPDLIANCQITDIEPLGLALGIGNQPFAFLIISNVDSGVRFSQPTYSVAENVQQGRATITVDRFGSVNGTAQVDFMTVPGGTAAPFVRYLPVTNTIFFNPGQTSQNVFVPVINDNIVIGDQTVDLQLANNTNTLLSAPSRATLTIVEDDTAPGIIQFGSPSYVVSETGTKVFLTVVRTNGLTGTVTVQYSTQDGTATAPLNYIATNNTLIFQQGQTVQTIMVGIVHDPAVLGNEFFTVNLSNPTGGASLGPVSSATVNVLEADTGVSFSQPTYVVSETTPQLTLNVVRPYGTNGVTQVSYATTNGTALAGTNYNATSGVLTFNPGETFKTLTLSILHDTNVTGNLSFGVTLSNPTGGAQLVYPSTATILELDAEAGVSFTNTAQSILENAGNAIVTVVCSNPNISGTTVGFATADGTAIAGQDYGATNGFLVFTNGITTNSFAVPIIDNQLVDGNRSFSVNLFSATAPGQLVAPTNLTITIIDNEAGLSFSSPTYTVSKSGVAAIIGVVRSGYTNSRASVSYATQNGTAVAGQDYLPTSGTLTFAPGQTSTNFSVTVEDSTTIKPDRTVLLQLSNPSINSALVPPSAATLTIVDNSGSLVGAAGSALVSESFAPPNGVIDPGEQVTLWFGFRLLAGTNVNNLQATLLATNGIASPSSPQFYGPLVQNGPSVSRQFSFTANGTNGQQISATFHLLDGTTDLGLVLFTYTLGTSTASFTNSAQITINDFTNAYPYPSVITVTNVGGALSKLTVTLTNLNHTYPSDIDALLVSPGGTNSWLMGECGGSYVLKQVTLTFDDAAANSLPQSSQITSGTYRPTTYAPGTLSLPSPAPHSPYNVGLSAFNGSNPLGDWKLYIIDDSPQNLGAITNGWYLTLITANPVIGSADLATSIGAAPNPVTVTSNITYSVAVNNYGPASATNVVVTNALPASTTFVPAASSPGYDTNTPGLVIYRVGTLLKDGFTNLTITALATATNVTVTNLVWASSAAPDPNPVNNTNSVAVTVSGFSADIAVALSASPNPAVVNGTLNYNILVSNAGPSTAPNVAVTNTLPPFSSIRFVSASPAAYVTNGSIIAFPNLGNLGSGASTNLTITVQTLAAATLSDTAQASSGVVDPLKGNNTMTIKTLVTEPPMSVALSHTALTISWPGAASGYVLESATNLNAPVAWTSVASPIPTLSGGQYSVTLGTSNATRFFRLHWLGP